MHYQGHRKRLRAKLKAGPEQLNDYEVLELLLGYVLRRVDTKPIAKDLLTRFSGLRGIMLAREEEILEVPGLGQAAADFFFLLQEFLARHAESGPRTRTVLATPEAVALMARARLGKLTHEEIWAAFLNNSNKLIAWERLSRGSMEHAFISPREILERALRHKAAAFILVHNHPAGEAMPSADDLAFTRQVDQAARTLLVRFLDHVIVTDNACYSMMSEGFLL
ncbi:DNA repair protein RadC [Desulfovibrio sp. OttesenSCG-928-M14]|nr:DNA repair protein RadC [Desulfovibrio sp. OttesenSCG-928-M14]